MGISKTLLWTFEDKLGKENRLDTDTISSL
jgi:hypothetical protein